MLFFAATWDLRLLDSIQSMNSILFLGEFVWLSVFFKIDTWWCGCMSLFRFIDGNCSTESCFKRHPLRWSANEITESCFTNWARCISKKKCRWKCFFFFIQMLFQTRSIEIVVGVCACVQTCWSLIWKWYNWILFD